MIDKYNTEGRTPKDFSVYQNPRKLFKNLREGNINPKRLLKHQINFKSNLDKINKENKKSKSEDQICVIQNIESIFDLREKIIDFFKDSSFLLSESEYRAKYGRVLKILTTKQIFQRLRIALAQVKVSNTSENLLNEIRQIIYSLY